MSEAFVPSGRSEEPSVLRAVAKYKWVFAAVTFVVAALAIWLSSIRPPEIIAEASIVLEDPDVSDVLGVARAGLDDRRVGTQVEILSSTVVAADAAILAADRGVPVTATGILQESDITSLGNTDVITIRFTGEDEESAVVVAQSVVDAYLAFLEGQQRLETSRVLTRLASAETILESQLEGVTERIDVLRSERQLPAAIVRVLNTISALQSRLAGVIDPEEQAALLADLTDARTQLTTLQLAVDVESSQPELAAALREQDAVIAQLASISAQQVELEIETETQGTGIAYTLPAAVVEASRGAGRIFTAAAGLILGLMAGAGVAYFLSTAFQRFEDRSEPAAVVGVPMLADVPRFSSDIEVPVRDDPRSAAAEAFRFIANSLVVRMERAEHRSLMVASASVGNGKSTVAANVALASARSGMRILAIDADFGNQSLVRLLAGEAPLQLGLTDLSGGVLTLPDIVKEIEVSPGVSIDLIGRGTEPVTAPDFFSARATVAILERIMDAYDLVVIDAPPITQVAYSTTIASICDATVLVIPHGSSPRSAQELAHRLEFVEIEPLGYIYNLAPTRPGMVEGGGSMRDVLGDAGLGNAALRSRTRRADS